jgi:hypothetical protein
MKTLNSYSRKDHILINILTEEFAVEFFNFVHQKLESSYIFNRKTEGNVLTYKGSLFRFVWNGWNLFNTISKGEIEFGEDAGKPFIRHKIHFSEILYIVLIFNIIPLTTLIYDPLASLIVFIAIWLVYGINYFVTVFRHNSYISETLIKVNIKHNFNSDTDFPALG